MREHVSINVCVTCQLVVTSRVASEMLRAASLAPEKSQVLSNSGVVLDTNRAEIVLQAMFPKMHKVEKRTGQDEPFTDPTSRPKAFMRMPNVRKVYDTEIES